MCEELTKCVVDDLVWCRISMLWLMIRYVRFVFLVRGLPKCIPEIERFSGVSTRVVGY